MLDSHRALGRVSALGRALPVLYMSPCLPRAPWAPTFGVRCCSGGSASCSPCRGLTVPAPCLLGRWLSSTDLPFHGLLVCLAPVLLPFGEFTVCFPGTSCVPRCCRGRSWPPVSCLYLFPRPSAASFRWSLILDLSLGASVGSSSAFPADFVSNLFRSRFLNWLILSFFLFLFALSFCPALLPVPLLLGAFPFMDLLLATSACSHGLPLASSTPTDFDRLCLLAAHTFFLFRN